MPDSFDVTYPVATEPKIFSAYGSNWEYLAGRFFKIEETVALVREFLQGAWERLLWR